MKLALFHPKARDAVREFPEEARREFGKIIFDLQKGERLSMPLWRPMASVASGVEELRVRDRSGAYRVFYYKKLPDSDYRGCRREGVAPLRRCATRSYVTHSRHRHSEPRHPRHFDGPNAACIGLARRAGETQFKSAA